MPGRRQNRRKVKIVKEEEEHSSADEEKNNDKNGTNNTENEDHSIVKRKKLEEKLQIVEENGQVEPEVDLECKQLVGRAKIYKNPDGIYYDAMLNQTNIQYNNNKFYLLQLLESKTGGEYWVWFRWGRVGFRGQIKLEAFGNNLEAALKMFHSKFYDKTHNEFLASQESFEKVHGKYDLIRIDYTRKVQTSLEVKSNGNGNGQNVETKNSKENTADPPPQPAMDERVVKLMQTLCDLKTMESEARRLDYDFKRIPLGKISKEQIKAGYEALSRIEQHIRDNKFDRNFTEAVNEYYTRIPHSFGMRTPPMIRTIETLKQEIELLDLLTGIEIAVAEIAEDPLERHYSRLKWELYPVEKDDQKYNLIEEYLLNQGPTHDRYRLQLRNVFELKEKQQPQEEQQKGNENKNVGSRPKRGKFNRKMLLWHGSRLTNWYSILAQGLRIAPPEAPVTGYMFGKGVYFADISSKSANYSMSRPELPGFLLLSEVSLGEPLDVKDADDQLHLKLPKGKHSVRGVGKIVPDPKGTKIIDDGVEVPCGKPQTLENADGVSLIYNEYIVYNREHIRERFLVEIAYQFDFQI